MKLNKNLAVAALTGVFAAGALAACESTGKDEKHGCNGCKDKAGKSGCSANGCEAKNGCEGKNGCNH